MSSWKYSFVVLILVSSQAFGMFTEKECLDANFSLVVSHKDKMTMGLAKTRLQVNKEKCVVEVSHQKLKFLKEKWKIDVCREPVHIKSGVKGVEVLKKKSNCRDKKSSDFCKALTKIREVIQDDGLIFAPGEKENLNTDHGRVYCTYQLLGGYLDGDRIYSRYGAPKVEKVEPTHPLTPGFGGPAVDPVPPENKQEAEEGKF